MRPPRLFAERAVAVAVAGVRADPGVVRVRRRAAVRAGGGVRSCSGRWPRPGCGSAPAERGPGASCTPSGWSRTSRWRRRSRSVADPWACPGAEVYDPFTASRLEVGGPAVAAAGRALGQRSRRHPLRPPRAADARAAVACTSATRSTSRAWRRSARRPRSSCWCCPRTEPVRWLTAAGRRRFELPDGDAASEAFAAVDLDGLRPYRPGTPASRIHWPALARGAGLIERRLQADGDTRPLIVLDTRGSGDLELLDAAVRAAASLTLELARGGGCGLLLPGEQRADRRRPRADQLAGGLRAAGPGARRSRHAGPGAGPLRRPARAAALRRRRAARAPARCPRAAPAADSRSWWCPRQALVDGRPRGVRGALLPTLDVSGCRGFLLGGRREVERPLMREDAEASPA